MPTAKNSRKDIILTMSTEKQYEKTLARVALNIQKQRKILKLSQQSMVDFGFDLRFYQRLESGKHSPSLYTLHRLSEVFKVDISEFFKKTKKID